MDIVLTGSIIIHPTNSIKIRDAFKVGTRGKISTIGKIRFHIKSKYQFNINNLLYNEIKIIFSKVFIKQKSNEKITNNLKIYQFRDNL